MQETSVISWSYSCGVLPPRASGRLLGRQLLARIRAVESRTTASRRGRQPLVADDSIFNFSCCRVTFGGESGERLAESKLQSRDLIQGQGQPGAAGLYMQDQVS